MAETVLIVVWFAVSQSYARPSTVWPEVHTQTFRDPEACNRAAATIKSMAPTGLGIACVPAGTGKSQGGETTR